jgi:hypothetical protein
VYSEYMLQHVLYRTEMRVCAGWSSKMYLQMA